MGVAIPGLRGTGTFTSDERPKNYRSLLLLLNPNTSAPLTAMIGQARNEMTDDYDFKVFLKRLPSQRALHSGTATAGDTTLTLDATNDPEPAKRFKQGHAVRVERTSEVMWVSQNPSSPWTQITVERGKGSTAVNLVDQDGLQIIGNAQEENSSVPTAINYAPDLDTNYTQTFRDSWHLSGRAKETRLRYVNRPEVEAQRETLEIHSIGMEYAFLFGSGVEEAVGTGAKTTTRGIFFSTTTNVQDFGGSVDRAAWDAYLMKVFADGTNTRTLFLGNRALLTLNQLAESGQTRINLVPRAETFGIRVQEWVTAFGTLMLVQHPLLSKNPTFQSWGFVVDFNHLVYRFLRNRDTRYFTNRQNPGDDGELSEYLSDAGLETQFEETHGSALNMTAAA